MPCSYDPRVLLGLPIGMLHCPECGCMVLAGMAHGACLDIDCEHYDAEADASILKELRERVVTACPCMECRPVLATIDPEIVEEIVFHALSIIEPTALSRWFHTPIPELDGLTPTDALAAGRTADLLVVVRAYEDPSFA